MGQRTPLDLAHPVCAAGSVGPRVASEALEEPAEQDRLPLWRLSAGLGGQRVGPLACEGRGCRADVEEEDGAIAARHQPGRSESQAMTSAAFRSGGKTG